MQIFLKNISQNTKNKRIAKQIKAYKRHQYHGFWKVFRRNLESRPLTIPMPFSDKVHIEVLKNRKCYIVFLNNAKNANFCLSRQ